MLRDSLSCSVVFFTNVVFWIYMVWQDSVITSFSLFSSSIPALAISHFSSLPPYQNSLLGDKHKSVTLFLFLIPRKLTITFAFVNTMWCSITLVHLLLSDISIQFSDGLFLLFLSLGFPQDSSPFILCPLMNNILSMAIRVTPKAPSLSTSVKSGSSLLVAYLIVGTEQLRLTYHWLSNF